MSGTGFRVARLSGTVEGTDGPIPVRDYRPVGSEGGRPLLWVHGGAFISGGLDQRESDAPARVWAASGRWVRTVQYRLAPRVSLVRDRPLRAGPGRFPAALHDVVDVIRALTDQTGAPIDVGGASAGANLAAAATLRLRDDGATMPRRLALAYGTFHGGPILGSPVYERLRGPLGRWAFNPAMLRRMNLNYVGDPEMLGPGLAFPGGSDLTGLPPTLIMDADNDRLRASGTAFAAELRAAGVEVRETTVRALHGFLAVPRSAAFRTGTREIEHWLS